MPTLLTTLTSFGDVAAEEDAVLEYFLTTEAARRIERNEAFLVLGEREQEKQPW